MANDQKLLVSHFIIAGAKDGTLTKYLSAIRDTGLMDTWMPELTACITCGGGDHHDETVYEHLIRSAQWAAEHEYKYELQLAALFHDIGKPQSVATDALGRLTFHSHEITGAAIVFQIGTRLEFGRELTQYLVHMTRHHMFRFPINSGDKTIKRWLLKVGPDWEDLLLLRVADRRGNKAKDNRPEWTPAMLELQAQSRRIISQSPVTFITDLVLSEREIKKLVGDKQMKEAIPSLVNLICDDASRNNKEWIKNYLQKVWPLK